MKAAEVRDMTVQELENKLVDLKKELFALRFQHTVNQLDNPARLKDVKKDIARVKTILTEKSKAE
ncbi:MAG: 50S ribosomal protein L29 [Oscillospiraceae bacterium]|jgi:large subunit ribosomal protein L29|nr:50S ribosomal protein L29 [Oscillospiraceae bacterium]MBQ9209301.1 50S ribosomal protein L29 [Oscillospiraceae bacterium]MBR4346588.1 50S ribosomal protein L29 [Oscillospiraceae bacterium]